jgi:hypothetical protein
MMGATCTVQVNLDFSDEARMVKMFRTSLALQQVEFEAMLQEMETDYNREHFDRKAPLDRMRVLNAIEKEAYESYLVRSCVSEFSGFLLFVPRQAPWPIGVNQVGR